MTAQEELRTLVRQFPRATELAVTRDLIDRFVIEYFVEGDGRYRVWDPTPGRMTFYGKPLTYWPEDCPVLL